MIALAGCPSYHHQIYLIYQLALSRVSIVSYVGASPLLTCGGTYADFKGALSPLTFIPAIDLVIPLVSVMIA